MKSPFVALVLFATTIIAAPAASPCTAEKRIGIAKSIIGAFNDPDPVRSAQTIQAAPFKPDGTIEFCINGAPCVRLGMDAQTSKAVAIAARQAVAHVDTKFSTYDNGTTIMDAVVTFGVGALGVPLPVKTAIYVRGDFDPQDCQIRDLPAYFVLPNEIAGYPVNPPRFPDLGLPSIPPTRV